MGSTRREFVQGSLTSVAALVLAGPALAAGASASADAQTGALIMRAAELDPANRVGDIDWAQAFDKAMSAGRDDLRAYLAALRGEDATFGQLSDEAARKRLLGLLMPGYSGPSAVAKTEVDDEIASARSNGDCPTNCV